MAASKGGDRRSDGGPSTQRRHRMGVRYAFLCEDCAVKRIFFLVLVVAFSIARSDMLSAQEDEGLRYVFPSWSKHCFMAPFGGPSCYTRIDAFSTCGIVTVVIAQQSIRKSELQIKLPPGARAEQSIHLTIDEAFSTAAPVVNCLGPLCTAAFAADNSLISRMKAGRSLVVQWLVYLDTPVRHTFPLAGLAEALDGPTLPTRERTAAEMDELNRRREQATEERRKRGGC
jgi:invasion protein IalB